MIDLPIIRSSINTQIIIGIRVFEALFVFIVLVLGRIMEKSVP